MKTCSKCGETKLIEKFVKRENQCKDCQKIYSKIYRETNKERIAINKKLYYEIHKEEILDQKKLYYDSHREKF